MTERTGHSKLGIASCVLLCLPSVMQLIMVRVSEQWTLDFVMHAVMTCLWWVFCAVCYGTGVGLGGASSLLQRHRKRSFGVVGLVLNLTAFLAICVGAAMRHFYPPFSVTQ